MSPEQFHDALNYLDDDLIAQTDDLRQGRRVLHRRSRRVVQWLVPAACLALVLGIGSGVLPVWQTSDSAVLHPNMENGEPLQPGEAALDYQTANSGSTISRQESMTDMWETYTCGQFSLAIPEGWTCDLESDGDSLYMVIRPPHEVGAIKVGYDPSFGVCGTGLTEKAVTIAGMEAWAGYYGSNSRWTYIAFVDSDYVILKDGADAWWTQHARTVEEILETFVIEE